MVNFPSTVGGALWDTAGEAVGEADRRMVGRHIAGLFRTAGLLWYWTREGGLSKERMDEARVVLASYVRMALVQSGDTSWMVDRERLWEVKESLDGFEALVYGWCHDGTLTLDQVRDVCTTYNEVVCTHVHEQNEAKE